ncbi:ribosome-binding factor A [Clostridia bacterium]|nr:ribosome-binding factor A [Clostridia bacterium]
MPSIRTQRVNSEMRREVADILRDVKDSKVSGSFITITKCDVTQDFKFAKIYFSVLGADATDAEAGLNSAKGFIRKEIASRMNLRATPELTFIRDEGIEHAAKITAMLKELNDGGN